MTELNGAIYVLKDTDGNYVGSNSISYCKKTKKYKYSYSKFLTNGFYTYKTKYAAEIGLQILRDETINIKNGRQYHVERIDKYSVLKNESKMDIPIMPFINVDVEELERWSIA